MNPWVYESKLGDIRYSLPPGDMGWPLIGNMWSFLRAFRSDDPDSFMGSFVSRRVLNDDDSLKPGWPTSTVELIGKKSFIGIPFEEHKCLRRLTAAPVNGHEALNIYIPYIEEIVISTLDKWSKKGNIEFLTELRKLTFRIIMYIFLSSESEEVMEALEREYTNLNYGVRAMAINFPGFAYHKALKVRISLLFLACEVNCLMLGMDNIEMHFRFLQARKNLVAAFQSVVTERRMQRKTNTNSTKKKDMLDALIDVKDEKGETLDDEEIIDIMLMYLNAGHESSGHTTMWAAVFLQQHPEYLQIAKVTFMT
ncbi:hypothetical protein GQ457_05G031440 [Hibiscus cannabinus]